ncbi:hypothetical protein ACVMAJ_002192 [Bradyrhizobium sp. USDA 4448]
MKHVRGEERADRGRAGQLLSSISSAEKSELFDEPVALPFAP